MHGGKCGVVAGEEEKPGAVKTAEAQAGVSHPSPCLFPPLLRRPCPISMAAAPTPVHPHPQVCLAVLQPERLSFLIRGHGHLHHFQYLN